MDDRKTSGTNAARCLLGRAAIGILAASLLLCAGGCVSIGKPARPVEQYLFEYFSPAFPGMDPLNAVLRVERFSAPRAFNTTAMVYRERPYAYNSYDVHRWRVYPADMTADFLIRDLRQSRLFRAVFSWRDTEEARFLLTGALEECVETETAGRRYAVVGVRIVLLDAHKAAPERVLLEKGYREREFIVERSAAGFARAASRDMERIVRQVIPDLYRAIRQAAPPA